MCESDVESELWHEEFHSDPIYFSRVTKSCCFSSLQAWKDRTCSFERAAHKSKKLTKDVDRLVVDGPRSACQFWNHLLQCKS